MSIGVRLNTEGFRPIIKGLRQADAGFPKMLQRTNKRVAQEIMLPELKRRGGQSFPNLAGGTSRLGARGVSSMRVLASQTRVQLAEGGKKAPWVVADDFGAGKRISRGRSHTGQLRGRSGRDGMFLYPTAKAKMPAMATAYTGAISDLLAGAFPNR